MQYASNQTRLYTDPIISAQYKQPSTETSLSLKRHSSFPQSLQQLLRRKFATDVTM